MIWTQLVYSTIVLTNLNVGTSQFYTGPSRDIRAADVAEICEATQERCAATNGSRLFTTNITSGVSYKVDEYDYYHWFDYTQTWYAATGCMFTAWNFSLIGYPQYESPPSYPSVIPPILDWRVSRMLLNRCVQRISDCAPRYVATNEPFVAYTADSLWAAAGSTNGAPNFGLFITTAQVWQVFRALQLMDRTWTVPTQITGSWVTPSWSSNAVATDYFDDNPARPDWMDDANLLKEEDWMGEPKITLSLGGMSGVTGGTEQEYLTAKGPTRITVFDYHGMDGHYWCGSVYFYYAGEGDGGWYNGHYQDFLKHSSSGVVDLVNLASGVTCSGRVCMAVDIVGGGGVPSGSFVSTGQWWNITHTGPGTNKSGRALWAEPVRLTNYLDFSSVVSTGHWGAVDECYAYASPLASLSATMYVSPAPSVIFWNFTCCPR